MSVHFREDPARMERSALLAYVDDLEGWLRNLMAPPEVTSRLQRAFKLQPGEARLLAALADGKEKQKEYLRSRCYAGPPRDEIDPKIIDVRICTLRAKVKPFGIKIETIHSVGYVLTEGGDVVAKAIAG